MKKMVSKGLIVCFFFGVLATAGCKDKKEAVAPCRRRLRRNSGRAGALAG
jgi:hypothetical protein